MFLDNSNEKHGQMDEWISKSKINVPYRYAWLCWNNEKKKLFQKFQKSSKADRRESQLKIQTARQTENVFLQKKKIIRKAEIV